MAPDASTIPFGLLPLRFVDVGDTRVAWSYYAENVIVPGTLVEQNVILRSVAKDGSAPRQLDAIDAFYSQTLGFVPEPVAAGDWLFYSRANEGAGAPGNPQLQAVGVDLVTGRTRVDANSIWVGGSYPSVFAPEGAVSLSGMIRLTGLPLLDAFRRPPTRTYGLRSIDTNDPDGIGVDLGTFPSGTYFALAIPGLGPERVGAALGPDGAGDTQTDIFYWVDGRAGSLQMITNTNGVGEFPAPLF